MAEGMVQAGGAFASGDVPPAGAALSLATTSSSTGGKKPILLERNPLGTQAAKSVVEPAAAPERPSETMAVIDIGTNAMRLAVAQLLPEGRIEQLERTLLLVGRTPAAQQAFQVSSLRGDVHIFQHGQPGEDAR